MNRFKIRLKELLKERNITQTKLSVGVNLTEDCVHNWEKGRSEHSIEDLINLSLFFQVSIDYLVGKTDI